MARDIFSKDVSQNRFARALDAYSFWFFVFFTYARGWLSHRHPALGRLGALDTALALVISSFFVAAVAVLGALGPLWSLLFHEWHLSFRVRAFHLLVPAALLAIVLVL